MQLLTDALTCPLELSNVRVNDWRVKCGVCYHVLKTRKLAAVHNRLPVSGGLFVGTKVLEQSLDPVCPRCKKGHMTADTLSLSFWTFSGQVIYYLTHQFFMVRVPPLPPSRLAHHRAARSPTAASTWWW